MSVNNDIRVQVVTTAEQLMHAIAIRAICCSEDSGLATQQAIDADDYQATHILAYVKQEPIGATRLRWFRDFAKIERTTFRPAYRNTRILRRCSDFVFEYVAKKGYRLLVTHSEPQAAQIWQRVCGFERAAGRPLVVAESHEPYVELIKRLPPSPDTSIFEAHPKTLFRIEGQSNKISVFETSDE